MNLRLKVKPTTWHRGTLRIAIFALSIAVLLSRVSRPASGQQPTSRPVAPRYSVLIDAAHGGAEPGARLSDHLLEKDFTLALSVRLRSILTAHGISVVTTREDDSNPSTDVRAGTANRAHPAACLLLHATTSGTGAHLYTSALAPTKPLAAGAPQPWLSAQAAYLTQSLKLSSDLREALAHAAIPITLGSVSMRPIDNMACPAVILEVAPLLARRGNPAALLGDAGYQTRVVDALGGALEQWRADWRSQP